MILRRSRKAALILITVLVTASALTSFAESYRGLYDWAAHHGLSGLWAACWPLMVDVFIAVGELALFVALADRWAARSRVAAWAVTLTGLAVSVAGNVGHVTSAALASRATAAVPPLAAAAALAVGLGVLKRVVGAVSPAAGRSEAAHADAQMPRQQPGSRPAAAAQPPVPAPRPRRKARPLEKRPLKVRRALLADLAAGRPLAELARQHKVSGTGMAAYRDRHAEEIAELAASNGHAA